MRFLNRYLQYSVFLIKNKKGFLGYLVFILGSVILYNLVYLTVMGSDNGSSVADLKNIYYSFIHNRMGQNMKLKEYVMVVDPSIVLTAVYFQYVSPLVFIYFLHKWSTFEKEKGVLSRKLVAAGRLPFFLSRVIMPLPVIVIPLLIAMIITIPLLTNTFVPVNIERQWGPFFRLLFFSIVYLVFFGLIILGVSLLSPDNGRSLRVSLGLYILLILLSGTPLRFIGPHFYINWLYHPNLMIFIIQLVIYSVFIALAGFAIYFIWKKTDLKELL